MIHPQSGSSVTAAGFARGTTFGEYVRCTGSAAHLAREARRP
jgi:hypothetical protein